MHWNHTSAEMPVPEVPRTTDIPQPPTTTQPFYLVKDNSDAFFLVSVVSPLLFCCLAIFVCALNSIWKTRKKLEELNKNVRTPPAEYTEYTLDFTTKIDSCVELSSANISSKESLRDELIHPESKEVGQYALLTISQSFLGVVCQIHGHIKICMHYEQTGNRSTKNETENINGKRQCLI